MVKLVLACSRIVVVKVVVDWIHACWAYAGTPQVTPEEADEAVTDIEHRVRFDPDPHSKSGRGVRVIGYSHSRNKILTVILVHREDGVTWGAQTAGSPAPQTGGGMRGASDERARAGRWRSRRLNRRLHVS